MSLYEFTTAASDYAHSIDRLFWLLVIVSGFIVCLVSMMIVVFLVKYRRGSKATRREIPDGSATKSR